MIARNPSSNPAIEKYQFFKTLQLWRKVGRILLLENSHEKQKINFVIKKNLQVNLAIRKHLVQTLRLGNVNFFKPYNQEEKWEPNYWKIYSQEKKKINPDIRKNLQLNPAIRKHRVFKPCDWKIRNILVMVKGNRQIEILG